MSRSVRSCSKPPKNTQPIPEVLKILEKISALPGFLGVTCAPRIVVRCPRSYLEVRRVSDDGLSIRVRGGGRIQTIYIKCKNPIVMKNDLESISAHMRYPSLCRNLS